MFTALRRTGLRPRLLALVLVPAVLLAVLAGSRAADKRDAADAAADIQVQIEQLGLFVDLRTTLTSARIPIEVEARARTLGLDGDTVLGLLALDGADFGQLDDVGAVLDRLPPGRRPFDQADLDRIQEAVDREDGQGAIESFVRLELLTDAAWDEEHDSLRTAVDGLGNAEVSSDLRDLNSSAQATSAMAAMVTGLADHWFAYFAGSTNLEPSRVELGVSKAQFDRSIAALGRSLDPDVKLAARTIDRRASGGEFEQAITDATAGRIPKPFATGVDLELMAAAFTDSFDTVQPLLELVDSRSTALDLRMSAVAGDAGDSAMRNLALAIGLVAVLVGLSLVVAATYERPLRRLIEGARRVGEGDLTIEPLEVSGPAEVEAATEAFNDVLANLQVLESKLAALADCNFDDPALAAPFPGQLGDELARSVHVLSGSILDRSTLQDRLEHQATHDALTGIPNRAGAMAALEAALARAQRNRFTVAVAFIDLDRFKQANDDHGHAAGDIVLVEVANRLAAQARSGDFYARLGGDEFVIIAENLDDLDAARSLASRVGAAIAEPVTIGEIEIAVGASIGVAFSPEGVIDADALLAHADRAAYRAKRARSGVELSDEVPIVLR